MQSRYVWSGRGGKGRRVAKGEHLGNVVTLDTSQVYSGFWQLLDTLGIKSSQHAGIPLYPAHSPSLPLPLSLCLSPTFFTPTWWTLFAFHIAYSTDLVTVWSLPKRPLSAVLGTFFNIFQFVALLLAPSSAFFSCSSIESSSIFIQKFLQFSEATFTQLPLRHTSNFVAPARHRSPLSLPLSSTLADHQATAFGLFVLMMILWSALLILGDVCRTWISFAAHINNNFWHTLSV